MSDPFMPQFNQAPVYIPGLGDSIRVGSFISVSNESFASSESNDYNSTSVARVLGKQSNTTNGEEKVMLLLFSPLFPPSKNSEGSHPPVPVHSFPPIDGTHPGSFLEELYQTDRCIVVSTAFVTNISFVFTQKEIEQPEIVWAQRLKNVYVARFFGSDTLEKFTEEDPLSFPNQHPCFASNNTLPCPPRCYHETVWRAMFTVRKACVKIMNKKTCEDEDQDSEVLTMIGPEFWTYLHKLVTPDTVESHEFLKKDSYLDMDCTFSRRKVPLSMVAQTMRFETEAQLHCLRNVLGFECTHGLTEKKPTIKDGHNGVALSNGRSITVVCGEVTGPLPNFRRYTRKQRVEFILDKFNLRVVISFKKYKFRTDRNGLFLKRPPTAYLHHVLCGRDPAKLPSDFTEWLGIPTGDGIVQLANQPADTGGSNDTVMEDTVIGTEEVSAEDVEMQQSCDPRLPQIEIDAEFEDDDATIWQVVSVDTVNRTCMCRISGGKRYNSANAHERQVVELFPTSDGAIQNAISQYC